MSLSNIAQATLAGQNAPSILHASEQAFLNHNIMRLESFAKDSLGVKDFFVFNPSTTTRPHEIRGPVCLESDDPIRTVSKMHRFGDNRVLPFLTIGNLELATLQPKVELKKIVYDNLSGSAGISIEKPEVYEGLISMRSNSLGQLGGVSALGVLGAQPDRADDVQLTGVEFRFKNQNPLGAGRIVDVKIELLMSKGESLLKKRTLKNGVRLGASNLSENELSEFRFTDLFRATYSLDAKEYNKKEYQIRLNLGWKTEDSATFFEQIDSYNITRDSLKSQEISLNLQLVNYNIDFRQDGKLALSLDYMSTIEDAYEDEMTNIFGGGLGFGQEENTTPEIINLANRLQKANKEIQKAQGELIQLEATAAGLSTAAGPAGATGIQDIATVRAKIKGINQALTGATAKRDTLQSDLNALTSGRTSTSRLAQNNVITYSKILKSIYQRRRMFSFSLSRESLVMYSSEFQKNLLASDPSLFINNLDAIGATSTSVFAGASLPAGLPGSSAFFRSRGGSTAAFSEALNTQVRLLPEVSSQPDEQQKIEQITKLSATNYASAFRNIEGRTNSIIFDDVRGTSFRPDSTVSNPDFHTFYFVFYGDLVAAAMRLQGGNVSQNMVEEKIGIILNSIYYTKQYNIPPLAGAAPALPSEDININLAYVPITLENYFNFFKKEIIDKKRKKYPIGEFIRDTLTKLVAPAINLKYFGQEPADKVILRANVIDTTRKGGPLMHLKYDPLLTLINRSLTTRPSEFSSFADMDDTRISDYFKKSIKGLPNLRKNEVFTYLNCYGASSTSINSVSLRSNYRGDYIDDMRNGIYHLNPSMEHGLLKDVRFSKRAMKYLAEASVFDSIQESDSQLTRMWNVFDAELIMVGNNLFKPGSLLYINTVTTGIGNPSSRISASRFLGLGGYYLVTSVDHNMVSSGKGKWETRVKAIWQSSGRNYK